ncbi:DUF1837 domain-containing protein [Pedobacter yonginense]|uniref:DUF1837 domain-containing protein n=1 Tax=Pedobacter yonginense TaxID=651869 RepID=A0A317ETU0_9SPHI|nr:DUF1837 domain-containing protein [Pedobacter yonginense]PWS28568.1 DUF1837 domain-containing protein [Pedobacter yonginense]
MTFDVLINDAFSVICTDQTLTPIDKKRVLSLANSFEDGKWQFEKFQNFIWDNIAETALSSRERQALLTKPHSSMRESAKKLRLTDKIDDISSGSELAEVLLYGVMKHFYNALPVVPKIYYKQNPMDNAKGADSVHIVVEGDDFTIWFGEAKFYNNIEDARLGPIIASVQASLATDKLKKENSIITDLTDLDALVSNRIVLAKIKSALSTQESIDTLKPKLHVPILLLHECGIIPKFESMSDEYKAETLNFHKQRAESFFRKQIAKLATSIHMYSEISFHIILFPVPSKEDIIKEFLNTANFYQPKK